MLMENSMLRGANGQLTRTCLFQMWTLLNCGSSVLGSSNKAVDGWTNNKNQFDWMTDVPFNSNISEFKLFQKSFLSSCFFFPWSRSNLNVVVIFCFHVFFFHHTGLHSFDNRLKVLYDRSAYWTWTSVTWALKACVQPRPVIDPSDR